MATHLLDRLPHPCHIVETGNDSFRFRHSAGATKARIDPREPLRREPQPVRIHEEVP